MHVALIGKGDGRKLAPLKGKGIVTWGVNDVVAHRECDVCFWMDRHLLPGTQMDRLITTSVNHTKTKMYSAQKYDDIPSSVEYPKDLIFSTFGTDYLADSLCYMLALAIYEGFDVIDLYGFNYAWGENYIKEKPCVQFWLGVAMGRGATINIYGDQSSLFTTADGLVYSYRTPQKMPKQGLKIKGFSTPEESVKLGILERIKLIGLIPKGGTTNMVRFGKDLRDKLMFNLQENKVLNFRRVDADDKNPRLVWDDNEIPEKEIVLTEAQKSMIASWLHALDRSGQMDNSYMGLYDKFCILRG